MKKLKTFETPEVMQHVRIDLEQALLAGSVLYNMTVSTMGQEVKDYDFTPEEGDHEAYWE